MSDFFAGQRVLCIDGKLTSCFILEILTQFPPHLHGGSTGARMRSGQITHTRDPQGRDER